MRVTRMGKMFAVAATAVALSASAAVAQSITYTTTGTFGGGTCTAGSSTCTVGGMTIQYIGLTNTTNPGAVGGTAAAPFGRFQTSGTGSGTFSTPFTLTITQTNPAAGSGAFSGTVSGVLQFDASGVNVVFSNTTVVLGGGMYTYRLPSTVFPIAEPNVNDGRTSIQGTLTVVPEPSTILLLGTGIAGLGLFGVRRRKSNAAV